MLVVAALSLAVVLLRRQSARLDALAAAVARIEAEVATQKGAVGRMVPLQLPPLAVAPVEWAPSKESLELALSDYEAHRTAFKVLGDV